jgi:hypothetical protein
MWHWAGCNIMSQFSYASEYVSEAYIPVHLQDTFQLLHDLFGIFDALSEEHGVYKVETIGKKNMQRTNVREEEFKSRENSLAFIFLFGDCDDMASYPQVTVTWWHLVWDS